jgi:membrane-bound ClpP family serine protease
VSTRRDEGPAQHLIIIGGILVVLGFVAFLLALTTAAGALVAVGLFVGLAARAPATTHYGHDPG